MEWRRKKLFYSKIMKKGPFCRISNFVLAKDPDIIISMRDYYNGTLFYCLFTRAKKHGVDLQLGGEIGILFVVSDKAVSIAGPTSLC